jgi:hypothetical protein
VQDVHILEALLVHKNGSKRDALHRCLVGRSRTSLYLNILPLPLDITSATPTKRKVRRTLLLRWIEDLLHERTVVLVLSTISHGADPEIPSPPF